MALGLIKPVDFGWNIVSFPCTLCDIMMVFFDTSNYLTLKAAQALESPMSKLLAAGLALWIAFQTLIYFSKPFSELNAADFLTKIGTMLFRALIGLFFIYNGCYFVFDFLLGPFFLIVSKIISLISTVNGSSVLHTSDFGAASYTGALSSEVRNAVAGLIGGFASGMTEMRKIGFFLMIRGLTGLPIPDPPFNILGIFEIGIFLPNPLMIVWGALIYIAYSIVGFAYSLMFLDVVFRLAFAMLFTPLAAAAWVFPSTQKYTKAIWTVIIHTAFVFVSSAIFLTMVAELARNTLNWYGGDFAGMMRQSKYLEAWQLLAGPLKGVPFVRNIVAGYFGLPMLFCVILVAFIALFGSKIPDEYAAHMTGSGFNAIENCAVKTLKFIVNTIIAIILLALTIVSYGAASGCPVMQGVETSAEAIDKAEKLRDTIEKIKKWKKRIKKIQEQINKAKK